MPAFFLGSHLSGSKPVQPRSNWLAWCRFSDLLDDSPLCQQCSRTLSALSLGDEPRMLQLDAPGRFRYISSVQQIAQRFATA